MPVLRINATPCGLALHDKPRDIFNPLQALAKGNGPAVIMLHGYKYAPKIPGHSPHTKIFGDGPDGWPGRLGFGTGNPCEGLAIPFAWYARGPLHKVYRRATELGEALSVLIAMLKAHVPHRPVHILAHSLGAQTALSALQHLPANAVDRMVLLTGAAFQSHAETMLATPAGATTEVFNITSRENDIFDLAFEQLVAAPAAGDLAIGKGIAATRARTIQLDCPATLNGLGRMGISIAQPQSRICHWSAYTRPGVMAFYNALLRTPGDFPLTAFDALLPAVQTPRWSRLVRKPAGWVALCAQLKLALRIEHRSAHKASLQDKVREHVC
ncbi:MAG: hypothetical protein AAF636_24885 [Pseudomonadota bacterium]